MRTGGFRVGLGEVADEAKPTSVLAEAVADRPPIKGFLLLVGVYAEPFQEAQELRRERCRSLKREVSAEWAPANIGVALRDRLIVGHGGGAVVPHRPAVHFQDFQRGSAQRWKARFSSSARSVFSQVKVSADASGVRPKWP